MHPDQKIYFKNKYRIPSARFDGWDYANEGHYFITICTDDKKLYFGDIKNEKMYLSDIGNIAEKFWLEIPEHFENASLDEYIVMPNHVHGIIIIKKRRDVALQRLYNGDNPKMSAISPKQKSVPVIIRSYKSVVSKNIHEKYPQINFLWQPRYYDHIIKDEEELNGIRQYIIDNPLKWDLDRNNPNNII